MTVLVSKVSRFIDENPIKVFAFIFIAGDLLFSLNVLTGASYIWLLGTLLSIVSHANNIIFGKGGDPNMAKVDYKLSWSSLGKDLKEILIFSAYFFTPRFWSEFAKALRENEWSALPKKLISCFKFWKHPLDFSWIFIFAAGILFAIDAANIMGLREDASMLQILIGMQLSFAAFFAFVTDRNDMAGSMFATVTLWTLLTSVVELNFPLFLSGIVFLYGNYLLGKTDSQYQSHFMIDTHKE